MYDLLYCIQNVEIENIYRLMYMVHQKMFKKVASNKYDCFIETQTLYTDLMNETCVKHINKFMQGLDVFKQNMSRV